MGKLQYFLTALSFLFALVLIARMLRERRSPSSTLAWLFVMVFIPYVGIPLYLLLGIRKIKKFSAIKAVLYSPVSSREVSHAAHAAMVPIERLLLASGVPAKTPDNDLEVLGTGERAYAALVQALEGARHEIYIATFILGSDAVGESVLGILERKARAGVRVRLLLDGLGSFWVSHARLRAFRRAGCESVYFLPLIHIPFFGHSNLRNHRKIVVVDGREAIIGGMNLATEYLGPVPSPERWVDLAVRVRGPAVRDFLQIFKADWQFAAGEKLPEVENPQAARGIARGAVAQVLASGPDIVGDPLYDSIATAVFSAQKRIWIATPYFIPDETLAKSLELAAKRGVDVRLFMPRKSNHFLADLCRGSYIRQLERAGGKIFLYGKSMMHAKLLIVDEAYSIVGSANLDMRSLFLNYEVGLLLYSQPAIEKMSEWCENLEARCELSEHRSKESWKDAILEGVARVFSPIL
jgi:cardiolipin synthase